MNYKAQYHLLQKQQGLLVITQKDDQRGRTQKQICNPAHRQEKMSKGRVSQMEEKKKNHRTEVEEREESSIKQQPQTG